MVLESMALLGAMRLHRSEEKRFCIPLVKVLVPAFSAFHIMRLFSDRMQL
jgi:hypothetical protein